MQTQTLEELKAENAKEETKAQPETAPVAEDVELEAGEEESTETVDLAEGEEEEGEAESSEAWMQSDEQGSEKSSEKLFTGSDVAAAKRKLKAKLEEKNNELEELRRKVEGLQSGSGQHYVNQDKPKRDDFLDADDPDEAFAEALVEWKLTTQTQQQSQQQMAQKQKQQFEQALDSHYEKAEKLVEQHKIAPEVYQAADRAFRSAIDQVMPGRGDAVADALIANLGDGSEKAVFFAGRNKSKLAEFQQALLSDPSGIRAAMVLGEIKSSVSMPVKNVSRAPKPATQLQGDEPMTGTALSRKLNKKYNDAHKSGNLQSAYDAKKQAKAAGVDVSKW